MAVDLIVEGFHALNSPEKLQSVPDGASITVRRMADGSVFINVVPPAQQAEERTKAASSKYTNERIEEITRTSKRLSDLEVAALTDGEHPLCKTKAAANQTAAADQASERSTASSNAWRRFRTLHRLQEAVDLTSAVAFEINKLHDRDDMLLKQVLVHVQQVSNNTLMTAKAEAAVEADRMIREVQAQVAKTAEETVRQILAGGVRIGIGLPASQPHEPHN